MMYRRSSEFTLGVGPGNIKVAMCSDESVYS